MDLLNTVNVVWFVCFSMQSIDIRGWGRLDRDNVKMGNDVPVGSWETLHLSRHDLDPFPEQKFEEKEIDRWKRDTPI